MIQQACQLGKTTSHDVQSLLHRRSREIVTVPKGAVRQTNGSWGYALHREGGKGQTNYCFHKTKVYEHMFKRVEKVMIPHSKWL